MFVLLTTGMDDMSTVLSSAVRLEGTPNFRDLGGLLAANGLRIKPGLLVRTEGPFFLTAEDITKLHGYNFKLVCDLRSELEREQAPNHWCEGADIELLHFNSHADLRAGDNSAWQAFKEQVSVAAAKQAMSDNYRLMPWSMADQLRTMFDKIIVDEQLPLMIHCTAGKDRTGVAIALLLTALGVPRELIYQDYLLSGECYTARFSESLKEAFIATIGADVPDEVLSALTSIERAYLDTCFNAIESKYDSVAEYLEQHLLLDAERLKRLQALFLSE